MRGSRLCQALLQGHLAEGIQEVEVAERKPLRTVHVLRDASRQIDLPSWSLSSEDVAHTSDVPWRITKSRLATHVDMIRIEAGDLQLTILPSRGMSIWTGAYGNINLDWRSPSIPIISPSQVDLESNGGTGWLDGFGGWIVRCGLASIGPPCVDLEKQLTLHGKIDYLDATYVEVSFESAPSPRLIVRGIVEEHTPSYHLELNCETAIEIGTSRIEIADRVTNRGDTPCEAQLLYHINLGPPLLGPGSQFSADVREAEPRDARAAENFGEEWRSYAGPQPRGYTEQAYFLKLGSDADGLAYAMLTSPKKDCGVVIEYSIETLPCFTLWKNEASDGLGYVTGLEPGTSFPNSRPFERAAGRVLLLPAGASQNFWLATSILTSESDVHACQQTLGIALK